MIDYIHCFHNFSLDRMLSPWISELSELRWFRPFCMDLKHSILVIYRYTAHSFGHFSWMMSDAAEIYNSQLIWPDEFKIDHLWLAPETPFGWKLTLLNNFITSDLLHLEPAEGCSIFLVIFGVLLEFGLFAFGNLQYYCKISHFHYNSPIQIWYGGPWTYNYLQIMHSF